MADLQQKLAECRERAEQGQNIANESFKNLKDALRDETKKLEAAELHKLKELGKPILGVVNVKKALAPANNPKRKIDLKQIEKAMNDKQKLEDLVQQFRNFAAVNNDNFDDIPFVYSHLQSAFFAQRENDESLRQLSNFDAVENFILEKFKSDGKFIRIKTFIDAVAEPMQKATSQFYSHSADSVTAWKNYKDKVKELDNWYEGFFKRTQNRYNEFIERIESEINGKINYIVNTYYDSEHAGYHWK